MKNIHGSLRDFFNKITLKSAFCCMGITFGVCALVLTGTVAFTNRSAVNENNGQGGFETPGMPIVTEDITAENEVLPEEAENVLDYNEELSYFAYRIRPGDMIGKIAEKFNITSDSIISVNNVRNSRTILPNEYLKIPTMPGILYTVKKNGETISSIAEKYKVDADKCASANRTQLLASLNSGTVVFVPDAHLDWVTLQEINGDLFKKPIHAKWYRSSRFGWRASPFTGARSYHSGVDMACPQGTSIFAALPGRVTDAGFNSTYGNYVVISHHSGYKTLYGHMSKISIKTGAWVDQSTRIGFVGSTGMSTGPHLHFTVFKNGKAVNPENLWS